jgi:hemerythrin superfamily protein
MPRPKKIVQEETKISEVVEVQEELVIESEEALVIEPVLMNVPELETFTVEETAEEESSKTIFKVYHLGNFVADVEENSDLLNSYLEINKVQLYDNVAKLKVSTSDQEDLVLFNVPPGDNRKYNSLAQYYQQNGLAPQLPKITDWMTYYKFRYPLASEEEIAIQVFGPLDYSFDIAI